MTLENGILVDPLSREDCEILWGHAIALQEECTGFRNSKRRRKISVVAGYFGRTYKPLGSDPLELAMIPAKYQGALTEILDHAGVALVIEGQNNGD